ncbi:MAG: GNAT family N-acetyltransferase [Thiotrichales bacterium]|nr:GNAT family N-acetyltransferase [Thiotrichales bacterium]
MTAPESAPRHSVRQARGDDVATCHCIESACFPDAEAAPHTSIEVRQHQFPEGFLVIEVDGAIAGFVNTGCTDHVELEDEAFKEMVGHDSRGSEMVIFSIAVTPELQGAGLSVLLMNAIIDRARELGKQCLHLLCKSPLVRYYERYGFCDQGLSGSQHGGASWHAMCLTLDSRANDSKPGSMGR